MINLSAIVRFFIIIYFLILAHFSCVLVESEKECTVNGWNHQTDYALCSSSFRLRDRHIFHVIFLAVASAFMIPSIFIFLYYDKLKQWRFVLHRNLILAIFIKNILVVTSKNLIIINAVNVQQEESVMDNDYTWCRVLTLFENLSKNLIFTCMTADATHSHKTIVRAFARDTNAYIMYGIIVGN